MFKGNISLSLNLNILLAATAIILIIVYTLFVYRYTIPVISGKLKFFLATLRIFSLVSVFFLIFEPIITIKSREIFEPLNLIFIDNSKSISYNDKINRKDVVKDFFKEIAGKKIIANSEFFSFGSNVKKIGKNNLDIFKFNETSTNFSQITGVSEFVEKNIASVIILSDGCINDGSNPIYNFEKLNKPVFTICLGDSTTKKDIRIENFFCNEYVYANTPTTVSANIVNNGFEGSNAAVKLFEDNVFITEKNIILNSAGFQSVIFDYMPQKSGEKKISISVQSFEEEENKTNNTKVSFINILDNKIKIILISGYPSADLSFIKNSLALDTNLTINTITQIGSNKYLENVNIQRLLDNNDIYFLINWPTSETSVDLIKEVLKRIKDKNKAFCITTSNYVDPLKLSLLNEEIPFITGKAGSNFLTVQPVISSEEINNPILQNFSNNLKKEWEELPPVLMPDWNIKPKPEGKVLAFIKVNNVTLSNPLIITKKIGNKRNIAILASDLWRWKLQKPYSSSGLFDRLILNIVKWLNASNDKKQVTIKTNKKFFSQGEKIFFNAEVYDESFNPVTNAEVIVKISMNGEESKVILDHINNGLYEGYFQSNKIGDCSFTGIAKIGDKEIGKDGNRFNIGDLDIELLNPQPDANLLKLISHQTNGKFYYNNNFNEVFSRIEQLLNKSKKEKIIIKEFQIWTNEWLLFTIILLVSVEWFIRKREGML